MKASGYCTAYVSLPNSCEFVADASWKHIAWHASMGFSVQFLEGAEEVGNFDLGGEWNETCVAWRKYYSGPPMYLQEDSGVAMPEGLERMGPMVLT